MTTEPPKKSIYRPRPISGFSELLPEWRAVELDWLDKVRGVFESFGFCNIETPAVEELAALGSKGEIDKEIYVLERLHAEDDGKESRLALHYDLTVPFARYTAQYFNELVFPFKRYQIQKSWRGERPQLGRFREFTQCDVDVINVDSLPLHFDAELPLMIHHAVNAIGVEGVRLHISNRKILEGYLRGLGFTDYAGAIRWLDKIEKLKEEDLIAGLLTVLGSGADGDRKPAEAAMKLARIQTTDRSFVNQVQALGVDDPLLQEGLDELAFVMDRLAHLPEGAAMADLSIARGFDYYTGTVYEGKLASGGGSVVAGGRYDDLAGAFINKKLPGVGVSLGLTRLFAYLQSENRIVPGPRSPAQVLVILWSEELRSETETLANGLRSRGVRTEMYHAPQKISRQISYAERKNIPYVWFPPQEPGAIHEVKALGTGTQETADPQTWVPAAS